MQLTNLHDGGMTGGQCRIPESLLPNQLEYQVCFSPQGEYLLQCLSYIFC
jgi:hypothetical protein